MILSGIGTAKYQNDLSRKFKSSDEKILNVRRLFVFHENNEFSLFLCFQKATYSYVSCM